MSIHFKKTLIEQVDKLHSVKEYKDIFEDIEKINNAINSINLPGGIQNAENVDEEM